MRALASFADRDPVPWANGAGQTTELVSLADSVWLTPGLRPWRLSIARLSRVGPFSALPGMARTFLPTAEVTLDIDGHVHSVPALHAERFHGRQAISLVGMGEPCFAVNLMVADEDTRSTGCDAATESGNSGQESESASGELRMSIGKSFPTHGFRFVLTLEAGAEYLRFQLFELEPGEAIPDENPVAVLQPESVDTHI